MRERSRIRANGWLAVLAAAGVALSVGSAISRTAYAYEVDNFTDRKSLSRDALPVLDAEINQILNRAVRQANIESDFRCNRAILRKEILRWVGPDPVSILEIWATFTGDLEKTSVSSSKSVYADASLGESPGIWIAGIGRSMRLNGFVVGTDKLGHFFMQGLDYYKRVHEKGEEIDRVLAKEHGEDGVWGLTMTGVKSYADMAANYQGYRFWSQLSTGDRPYVRCEGKKWVKAREFSWKEYVSAAWDEAINCSEMKPTLEAKVEERLEKLGLQCPIAPERCKDILHLDKAQYFLSPKCKARLDSRPSQRASR